ncbi:hypothetical protein, partial [Salmonella enterica]|uniref:hypothetical protein n=1 Tax=Salmonella enterica TaxID=28901 RepID=UPI002FF5900D
CILQEFFNSTVSQEPRKKPVFADTCVFVRIVCGWGSCDDGDRTRESSATGAESFIDSGHLMSCHKNRM